MQSFPQPPKSYSLIKNLLPSVSLLGETSQVQDQETTFHPNPQITSEVDSIIQSVQNLSLNDLKSVLNIHLIDLQQLNIPPNFHSTDSNNNKPLISDDLMIQKLKQLKLITQVMVERMNEKYHQAENSFKELDKTMKVKNRKIGVRSFFYWKKTNKQVKQVKSNKIDQSQSTQKKLSLCDTRENQRMAQSDKKRTRKQEEKQRSVRVFSSRQ